MNHNQGDDSGQWTDCRAGTLRQFSDTAQPQDASSRRLVGVAVMSCMLLAVGVGVASLYNGDGSGQETQVSEVGLDQLPRYGGIRCTPVVHEMDVYFRGGLDRETKLRTIKHLLDCPRCRKKFEAEAERRGVELDLVACNCNRSQSELSLIAMR